MNNYIQLIALFIRKYNNNMALNIQFCIQFDELGIGIIN